MKIKIHDCNICTHTWWTSPRIHPPRRPLDEYWELTITKLGNYIYRCKQCVLEKTNKLANDKKTLPDEFVINEIIKKTALLPQNIPQNMIEAKRAELKLKYVLKNPILTCPTHGKLYLGKKELIKAGKSSNGEQRYKCKACMKELHKKHYEKNKDKILAKQVQYRKENIEKVRQYKRKSFIKNYDKHKKVQRVRNARYRDRHGDELKEKHSKRKKMYADTLHDVYIKKLLVDRDDILKAEDIPKSLIEFKRTLEKLKRQIKKKKTDCKIDELLEKMNAIKNKKC